MRNSEQHYGGQNRRAVVTAVIVLGLVMVVAVGSGAGRAAQPGVRVLAATAEARRAVPADTRDEAGIVAGASVFAVSGQVGYVSASIALALMQR